MIFPLPAIADGYGFMTPSGNIFCNGAVLDGYIECTIVEKSGSPAQPRPYSCSGTWGHSFALDGTGPARLSCESKPPQKTDYSDVAGYGQTAEFGPITCTSERTGLTCRNQSGNGFFMSRSKQEVF
ncbi:DUF6636 domain-containing protein [Arenibacterium sp. LLYu02]|uniref:DUF6636 domain-containing protein n=1 Tax=Arenibacterium sp. LLYu02 TaxID=3404132 RepID=UPI003B20B5F4